MNKQNKRHRVLGMMSGTSLDGLDLCISDFYFHENRWNFTILEAITINYPKQWELKLKGAETLSGEKLMQLHFEYGNFLGEKAREFLKKSKLDVDLIASHGHTVFHQIESGFTFQLGHGAAIAAKSNLPCVSDFRSLDVALGGQGAPLVPYGEKELFPNYSVFMNFGGICNVSIFEREAVKAFDICPFNMVLNFICQKELGIEYDDEGKISKTGKIDFKLYESLNSLNYYHQKHPKSLGKEWLDQHIIPIIIQSNLPTADKLNTFSQHIVYQICKELQSTNKEILVSGGGAKNLYILNLLKLEKLKIKVPEEKIIDFKEALIFGFLGLKRFLKESNILKNVTGSLKDSSGGSLFIG